MFLKVKKFEDVGEDVGDEQKKLGKKKLKKAICNRVESFVPGRKNYKTFTYRD